MRKRKSDYILIIAIVLVAALLWVGLRITGKAGTSVRVTVDGKIYGEYRLDDELEIRIGDEKSYNMLIIQNGEAYVAEASCPDKLCVHQGKIHYSGQSIVCLPNKVVVEVVGGEQSEYDAVAR